MVPPDHDEANHNFVSCASSVSSSSTSMTNTSTTTTEVTNKQPRSTINNVDAVTTTMNLSPARARAQSTDSGTSFPNSTATTKTTVDSPPPPPPPPPPPLRHRCFSTDSSLTTSPPSCYNSSPPPLPPGRRRTYSSCDTSVSSSVRSSSRSLQGRKRLERGESKNKRRSGGDSTFSSVSSCHSPSTTERRGSGSNVSPPSGNRSSGGASATLGLQTLEMELQKNTLLYGKRDAVVGPLWIAIGNSHFRNGNHRAAIQAYKQAGSCDHGPHTATANLNLGTVFWNLLKVDKSIKYLQQALTAFESSGEAAAAASLDVASCHHQLGLAYSLQHRFGEAVRAMEKACRMRAVLLGTNDPTTARTLDALGRIHFMRGDYNQALTCHEQALYALRLARFPTLSTLENIATVHMRRRDFAAAILVYVQVVYMHKSTWQQQQQDSQSASSSGAAEQYYESLQQLAMAYDHVGETKYADHCRQEAAEVLERLGCSVNAGEIERSSF